MSEDMNEVIRDADVGQYKSIHRTLRVHNGFRSMSTISPGNQAFTGTTFSKTCNS